MKNRNGYLNNWNREHKDRFSLMLPIGDKEKIKAHAEEMGESINAFINRAIKETMERDREKMTDT